MTCLYYNVYLRAADLAKFNLTVISYCTMLSALRSQQKPLKIIEKRSLSVPQYYGALFVSVSFATSIYMLKLLLSLHLSSKCKDCSSNCHKIVFYIQYLLKIKIIIQFLEIGDMVVMQLH